MILRLQYPKKFVTQKNCNPKKLQPKKILASFTDPKQSLLAKSSDLKTSSEFPPFPLPSLKYVIGALEVRIFTGPVGFKGQMTV